jgi:hypothetical protein
MCKSYNHATNEVSDYCVSFKSVTTLGAGMTGAIPGAPAPGAAPGATPGATPAAPAGQGGQTEEQMLEGPGPGLGPRRLSAISVPF